VTRNGWVLAIFCITTSQLFFVLEKLLVDYLDYWCTALLFSCSFGLVQWNSAGFSHEWVF